MPIHTKTPVVKLKYVGSDVTAGYATNTTTETVIGQVTIPAGTVKTGVIVIASLTSENNTDDVENYTYKIRCGTTGTTSDTDYAAQLSNFIGIAGERHRDMGIITTYITVPNWSVQNYVSITVQMFTASSDLRGYCEDLVVFGE